MTRKTFIEETYYIGGSINHNIPEEREKYTYAVCDRLQKVVIEEMPRGIFGNSDYMKLMAQFDRDAVRTMSDYEQGMGTRQDVDGAAINLLEHLRKVAKLYKENYAAH